MANLQIGDKAIPFTLPGIDDQDHALADYGDKQAVVLVFTCNHCPYVLAWEERLFALQDEFAQQGAQFIGIGSNDAVKYPQDDFEHMKAHAAERGMNFPYLRDESQAVAQAYGAERTPEVFLFNGDGVLQYHGTVDDNHERPEDVTAAYLRDALAAVVQGETPPIAQTEPKGCTIKWK